MLARFGRSSLPGAGAGSALLAQDIAGAVVSKQGCFCSSLSPLASLGKLMKSEEVLGEKKRWSRALCGDFTKETAA